MQIIPAILTDQLGEAEAALIEYRSFSRVIHVDVLDDTLIPGRTLLPGHWPLVTGHLLSWHLMVAEPEQYVDDCLRYATDEIIVHAELGVGHLESVIRTLTAARVPIALAIKPETPVALIASELPKVQSAQVMTVEPGAQGRAFLHEQLPKLAELRRLRPTLKLSVDGGITPSTIHQLAGYRPDRVVVGSFLKPRDDLVERWETLKRAANF